ncbi:MAG: serine/threonine-protein kinase [Planctomycetaceae bacterium]|nr:serine/threonine-protein kinase [Planctomycetaceae bacterium]
MSESCLSQERLLSLLEDQLAEPERSRAEQHLSDCHHCQSAAELIIAEISVDLAPARETIDSGAGDEQHRIETLIRQVQQQLRGPSEVQPAVHGQFLPGSPFAGRYRIVALLGKGSMGEVYRADDLKLSQTIALKLLPEHLRANPMLRASIVNEVRLSRRITHPHVCRVHDIEETADHLFLTMEYIDGENLATLLRRIGRIPDEKGLQIARELSLGLSAAHEQGVIHRDLKPANVMIDLRGRVRINDFGLAQTTADRFQPRLGFAGTPAYAAPEQMLENEVSVRSDLFSLGLILYELFLGRRVCELSTLESIRAWHQAAAPIEFPEHFCSFDPGARRMIERCLSRHPGDRPASADEVAMAFSGADPVQVALAAGTAPSPEVLAEAGVRRPLTHRQVGWCVVIVVGLLAIIGLLSPWTMPAGLSADQSPSILSKQARDILRELGYDPPPGDPPPRTDRASGFSVHRQIRGPVYFWYRRSPRPLVPRYFLSDPSRPMNPSRGMVHWDDPPLDVPGMVLVWLDGRGALRGLRAVPVMGSSDTPAEPALDQWQTVLGRLTQLDLSQHRPHRRVPSAPVPADAAIEWLPSTDSSRTAVPRLDAAFLQGRLVYLRVDEEEQALGPALEWNELSLNRRRGGLGVLVISVGLIVWGGLACCSQAAARRMDYSSVFRLGVATFVFSMAAWLLRAKHVLAVEEAAVLQSGLAHSLLTTIPICLWYAAIEYSLRKHAPDSMIGWTKLLRGDVRDPHVGRDVLAGVIGGMGIAAISGLTTMAALLSPGWPLDRMPSVLNDLVGTRYLVAAMLDASERSISMALGSALLWLICRKLPGRLPPVLVFLGVVIAILAQMRGGSPLAWCSAALVGTLATAVVMRFGVLATAVMVFIRSILLLPIASDASAWFAENSFLALLVVVSLALFGLLTAGPPIAVPWNRDRTNELPQTVP